MKKDIHPESYRPVVFKDSASGFTFLSKSCARSKQTVTWEDGDEYPLVVLGISSASHPFYTGKMKLIDTAGMIDRYRQRYGMESGQASEDEAAPEAHRVEETPVAADTAAEEPAAESSDN